MGNKLSTMLCAVARVSRLWLIGDYGGIRTGTALLANNEISRPVVNYGWYVVASSTRQEWLGIKKATVGKPPLRSYVRSRNLLNWN